MSNRNAVVENAYLSFSDRLVDMWNEFAVNVAVLMKKTDNCSKHTNKAENILKLSYHIYIAQNN